MEVRPTLFKYFIFDFLQGKLGSTKVNTWRNDLAVAVAAWLAAINMAAGHILQPGTYQCCWEDQGHTE